MNKRTNGLFVRAWDFIFCETDKLFDKKKHESHIRKVPCGGAITR